MKKITKERLAKFIEEVALKKPSDIPGDDAFCYYSQIDNGFFTR